MTLWILIGVVMMMAVGLVSLALRVKKLIDTTHHMATDLTSWRPCAQARISDLSTSAIERHR